MAAGRLLNLPDPLQLSSGNVSQNWKRFKQKWSNYELAIGTARKEDPIRVATFLTVIDDEALDDVRRQSLSLESTLTGLRTFLVTD